MAKAFGHSCKRPFTNVLLICKTQDSATHADKLPQAALPSLCYARVSTEEEDTDPQLDELRAAGSVTLAGACSIGCDMQ